MSATLNMGRMEEMVKVSKEGAKPVPDKEEMKEVIVKKAGDAGLYPVKSKTKKTLCLNIEYK